MKRIRPKPYVHIKFKPHGAARARWYWAIKVRDGFYRRCLVDGDTVLRVTEREDGVYVETEEVLIGEPIEERRAVMNLHYAELKERALLRKAIGLLTNDDGSGYDDAMLILMRLAGLDTRQLEALEALEESENASVAAVRKLLSLNTTHQEFNPGPLLRQSSNEQKG